MSTFLVSVDAVRSIPLDQGTELIRAGVDQGTELIRAG